MRDVAIWKYLHQIPVEDKAREKMILEDIRRRSEEKGLSECDISVVMEIFEDQIHVARMMQTDWIKKISNSDLKSPGSLDQQIRPKIQQITWQQLDLIFSQILGTTYPGWLREIISESLKARNRVSEEEETREAILVKEDLL